MSHVDKLCPVCAGRQLRMQKETLIRNIFCPICGQKYLTCCHDRSSCIVAFLECADAKKKIQHAERSLDR